MNKEIKVILQITPKYQPGDIVRLLNGNIRRIFWTDVKIYKDGKHYITYQFRGLFQSGADEDNIAEKIR